jgi:AraC-like DNA-binding protein
VAPFLRSVGDGLLDGTVSEDDADLGEGVVDLVRGLFARRGAGPRGDLLADAKATIELRLDDPDLGPATVAATHFISTRYLHRLFEPEGVTVSEWIRMRRLEHCRRDLEDPALAHETVLAIASRWGLRNPGHFSRLFHAAYGVSPSAVRGRASARR